MYNLYRIFMDEIAKCWSEYYSPYVWIVLSSTGYIFAADKVIVADSCLTKYIFYVF